MKWFDKNSLVTQILGIFIIFNIVVVTSFTFYVQQQDRKNIAQNVKDSLQGISEEKAHTLSIVMGQFAKETVNLAKWTSEFLESEKSETLSDNYKIGQDGILYHETQSGIDASGQSSIFFPANTKLDEEVIRSINATEKLDPILQKMMDQNLYLQWAYIATEKGLLRIYPHSPVNMYHPNHLQKYDHYYVVANEINNPERKAVWTTPYVDFLGTGWMITCSAPIYQADQFVGVACVDVRLDTIQKKFLADFRLGDSGFAYLLDDSGAIIYHPLFMPTGNSQGQTFLTNIIRDTDLDSNYKEALKTVLASENGVIEYTDQGNKNQIQMIAYASVDSQPWKLAVEINQKHFLSFSNVGSHNFLLFAIIIISIIILLAIILLRQYARPFKYLINRAKNISEGNFDLQEPIYNYTEIEALSNAFNSMSMKIKDYTDHLIEKNREIQSIINGIGGLLMILDPKLNIITINENAKNVIGKNQEQIKNKKCYEVIVGCNEICKGCKIRESIQTKSTGHAKIAINDDIFQNTYYPVLTSENEISGIVVYSQKITKRVMLEKELVQSEKMSEIGQLTSAIAHELKNPLAVIKGSTYLLTAYTKQYNDETVGESIETIMQTTEYAEKVIYSLLEFSSPSQNHYAPGDITRIVDQALLLTRRDRIQRDITIETDFKPNPLIFFAEMEPLKHIVLNLISNAINALEGGGIIWIKGSYKKEDEEEKLILSVKDNGPGIEEGLQEKIFHPFFTADASGKGNGMGLWITKIMVERMEGTMELRSSKDTGTEFIIILPAYKE